MVVGHGHDCDRHATGRGRCTPSQPPLLQVPSPSPSSLHQVLLLLLLGLCMRLFLRLPPSRSSVVVCMQKNPNRDGLVRTVSGHRRGGVRTHWKGQTPGLVRAWKCRHRHVLVCPRTRCCLHGMQKNPSREGLVRTVSGHGRRVRTCWKGQTTGTGQAIEDTQLGQRKRAQMWWLAHACGS